MFAAEVGSTGTAGTDAKFFQASRKPCSSPRPGIAKAKSSWMDLAGDASVKTTAAVTFIDFCATASRSPLAYMASSSAVASTAMASSSARRRQEVWRKSRHQGGA